VVHNVYLEYAVELGLLGLALFVALAACCLRSARDAARAARRGPRPDALVPLLEGLRVALLAFLVAGLFHPAAYHFYFYLLAGLVVAGRSIVRREQLESRPAATARAGGARLQ
jgi:O-antigen ligase